VEFHDVDYQGADYGSGIFDTDNLITSGGGPKA